MKIMIHSDEYLPRHVPIAIRMHVFYEIFQGQGNKVKILTGSHSMDGGKEKAEEAIYCATVPLRKKTSFNRMVNQISFAMSSLLRSMRAGKSDIIITSSPPILIGISAWLIAKLKGATLIYDVRDIWPDVALEMGSFTDKSLYYKIFKRIAEFMFRHSDIITTVSVGKKIKIEEKLPAGHKNKVWLVENGLDESFLQQEENSKVVKKYNLDQERTIVYFGNIGLAQGLEHLLNLASELNHNEYQILLFGDGVERERLEMETKRRNLKNVSFCGRVNENTVYTVLRHSFCAYIPLVNSNLKDSIPTKTYEALGAGCPILLIAEGDATELIQETGFGMSLSPDHMTQLPDTFRTFCKRYPEIIEKKESAKAIIVNQHSRQKITAEFERKMREYVGGKK